MSLSFFESVVSDRGAALVFLVVAAVSPNARIAVEMTGIGLQYGVSTHGSFPSVSLHVGFSSSGPRIVQWQGFDCGSQLRSHTLPRSQDMVRQVSIVHSYMPAHLNWWVSREMSALPLSFALKNWEGDVVLDPALTAGKIMALLLHRDSWETTAGYFSLEVNFTAIEHVQDVSLMCHDGSALPGWDAISKLRSLQQLYIGITIHIPFRSNILSELKNLRTLVLYCCREINDVAFLSELKHLSQFTLECCSRVTSISALSACNGMRSLRLVGCEAVAEYTALEALPSVQHLTLNAENLPSIAVLGNFTILQNCSISHCSVLTTFNDLAFCTQALRTLRLEYCENLRDLDSLSNCVHLESLALRACDSLVSIAGAAGAPALSVVTVMDCILFSDLGDLHKCTNLKTVNIHHCKGLHSVRGLRDAFKLQNLRLHKCPVEDVEEVLETCPLLQVHISCCK